VPLLCDAWRPDLILLDLHMPERSGYDVMRSIAGFMNEPESLPVLVVTADTSQPARHEALALGARDFVTKPIDGVELLLRVRNHLLTRHLQRQLRDRNEWLDGCRVPPGPGRRSHPDLRPDHRCRRRL
jgi:putative two-component system response regulator